MNVKMTIYLKIKGQKFIYAKIKDKMEKRYLFITENHREIQ